MEIMIHACPSRMWYVNNYIIPSLTAQGIPRNEIAVWNDSNGDGNLKSCMLSFAECAKHDGDTWHLQDDVLICRDFAERIDIEENVVVCGFCHTLFEPFNRPMPGYAPAVFMYNSFPCIRIPNRIAGEFVEWLEHDAPSRPEFREWLESGKHDDTLWHYFFEERHGYDHVWNLVPNLVEHVDWLIGGSSVNQWRGYICRAAYWEDQELVENLKEKLARDKRAFFMPTRG